GTRARRGGGPPRSYWPCGRRRRNTTPAEVPSSPDADRCAPRGATSANGRLGSPGHRVEGKHPCQRVAATGVAGPITRICPLAGPNEAMAFEAPMEAWFADPHASRPEENAEEDSG